MQIINIPEFPNCKPDKAQFLKLLEESAEVYSAWEKWSESNYDYQSKLDNLLNEVADVMQCCVNIFSALDSIPNIYIVNMIARNEKRGRYDNENVNEGWI